MATVITAISCKDCHSKKSLIGTLEGRGYVCTCSTCATDTPLPSECTNCGSKAATVKRSGAQYRQWCSDCKTGTPLFYDCRDVAKAFLNQIA